MLCGAYALLLHPSAVVLTSPKTGGRSPSGISASPRRGAGAVDIRRTFRSCLECPFSEKSLTFARVSLLPSFGTSSTRLPASSPGADGGGSLSSNFDFYMSVLSEYTSRYLDTVSAFGELPMSRAQWLDDTKKNIEFHLAQEEQRRQFGQFTGVQPQENTSLKTEVDFTERYDCLDDVLALAVAVCSACPDCAHQFWSTVEEPSQNDGIGPVAIGNPSCPQYRLVPSRALRKLEHAQVDDHSLLPTYLSFLAAVALANAPVDDDRFNGAHVVHDVLMGGTTGGTLSPGGASNRVQITWPFLLNMICYYADQLTRAESTGDSSKSFTEGLRRTASGAYETDGTPSTAYYYGADSNATDGERGSYSSQQNQNGTATSSSSAGQERFVLDEDNKYILLSILSLIAHVSSRSSKARLDILSMEASSPGEVGNDALIALFSLIICPLPPDVRGLAFVAIGNLIRGEPEKVCSDQEKERIAGYAKQAWTLLEQTQVLPIGLLGQYAPMPDASRFTAAPGAVGNAASPSECMMQSGILYFDQVRLLNVLS